MGGNLNARKSWDPNNLRNQVIVHFAETKALEEKKAIQQLQKERAIEREREQFQNLLNEANAVGANKIDTRLGWMYERPIQGSYTLEYFDDAFLLGKRRSDIGPGRHENGEFVHPLPDRGRKKALQTASSCDNVVAASTNDSHSHTTRSAG